MVDVMVSMCITMIQYTIMMMLLLVAMIMIVRMTMLYCVAAGDDYYVDGYDVYEYYDVVYDGDDYGIDVDGDADD